AQTAEHPMKDAATGLDSAKDRNADPKAAEAEQKKQIDARNEQLDKAAENEQAAADNLQKALDKMGGVGGLRPFIDKIQKYLSDQHDLSGKTAEVGRTEIGKTPENMDPAK